MTTTTNPIAGVARSAMLVDLNIKVYSGRKKDKYTQERVVLDSHAGSSRASSVYKNLFADCAVFGPSACHHCSPITAKVCRLCGFRLTEHSVRIRWLPSPHPL